MHHARGMDIPLADEFIGMYVNDYTLDYGDSGRRAIRLFLAEAHQAGLIPQRPWNSNSSSRETVFNLCSSA